MLLVDALQMDDAIADAASEAFLAAYPGAQQVGAAVPAAHPDAPQPQHAGASSASSMSYHDPRAAMSSYVPPEDQHYSWEFDQPLSQSEGQILRPIGANHDAHLEQGTNGQHVFHAARPGGDDVNMVHKSGSTTTLSEGLAFTPLVGLPMALESDFDELNLGGALSGASSSLAGSSDSAVAPASYPASGHRTDASSSIFAASGSYLGDQTMSEGIVSTSPPPRTTADTYDYSNTGMLSSPCSAHLRFGDVTPSATYDLYQHATPATPRPSSPFSFNVCEMGAASGFPSISSIDAPRHSFLVAAAEQDISMYIEAGSNAGYHSDSFGHSPLQATYADLELSSSSPILGDHPIGIIATKKRGNSRLDDDSSGSDASHPAAAALHPPPILSPLHAMDDVPEPMLDIMPLPLDSGDCSAGDASSSSLSQTTSHQPAAKRPFGKNDRIHHESDVVTRHREAIALQNLVPKNLQLKHLAVMEYIIRGTQTFGALLPKRCQLAFSRDFFQVARRRWDCKAVFEGFSKQFLPWYREVIAALIRLDIHRRGTVVRRAASYFLDVAVLHSGDAEDHFIFFYTELDRNFVSSRTCWRFLALPRTAASHTRDRCAMNHVFAVTTTDVLSADVACAMSFSM
jgi:hypothetical protein